MGVKLNDMIYGSVDCPAVIAALLESTAVKRLGGIHQSGAVFLVEPRIKHTRLEHSIGVCMLIRFLGGSELEQIAGLLHDLSHTAFSHVGDYVYGHQNEDFHELQFERLLMDSDIPGILVRFGYSAEQILRGNFGILERELPELCADRLDYTLRDAMYTGMINRAEALQFLNAISVRDHRIIVMDEQAAQWINAIFERLNVDFFNNPLNLYASHQLAKIIKQQLGDGRLKDEDLFRDDIFVLNKIRSSSDGLAGINSIKKQEGLAAVLKKSTLNIKKRVLNVSAVS
ncbi:MAG: HD domain-containing protein [Pedobacter sp.]|nr:MAG: HD domain-containing protein [Pedobacter sp.]